MIDIQPILQHLIENSEVEKYELETLTIKQSLPIAQDEVVVVYACNSINYSYTSTDEYYSDSEELAHRLTINRGFLEIESGTPQLQAVRLRFTKYKEPQEKNCTCHASAIAIAVSQ